MNKFDRTLFFSGHRAAFGPLRQHQVEGLEFLLSAYETHPLWQDIRHVAYSLATIRRETGISKLGLPQMYLPIEEAGGRVYLSKYYLNPRLRRALGNTQLSDAWNFKGRGYVQITGRANYTRFQELMGIPLVASPELALKPEYAFAIMTRGMHEGLFTGKKLGDFIGEGFKQFYNARRIINALDHAGEISYDAIEFEDILTESLIVA